jgi:hypothetical protein
LPSCPFIMSFIASLYISISYFFFLFVRIPSLSSLLLLASVILIFCLLFLRFCLHFLFIHPPPLALSHPQLRNLRCASYTSYSPTVLLSKDNTRVQSANRLIDAEGDSWLRARKLLIT